MYLELKIQSENHLQLICFKMKYEARTGFPVQYQYFEYPQSHSHSYSYLVPVPVSVSVPQLGSQWVAAVSP